VRTISREVFDGGGCVNLAYLRPVGRGASVKTRDKWAVVCPWFSLIQKKEAPSLYKGHHLLRPSMSVACCGTIGISRRLAAKSAWRVRLTVNRQKDLSRHYA
jgi:hypothetical protein